MPRKHSRVRSKKSKKTTKKKSTRRSANSKIRGGGVFSSAVGFLTPKLTDATIRRAVKDYLGDGARKKLVVVKYGDISHWDVSNVTDMSSLFENAGTKRTTSFNQPLNNWNVSNVKDMFCMFQEAKSFNQPLNKWNMSNVRDMRWMFSKATSFNQSLNNWNVSNVTYIGVATVF